MVGNDTTVNNILGGGSGVAGGGGGQVAEADHAINADEAQHAQEADHAASAADIDSTSTIWQKFLRKDVTDTAAEVITFAKGIISTLVSKFRGGILIGASDQFGVTSSGDATLRDISGRDVSATGSVEARGNMVSSGRISAYGNISSSSGNVTGKNLGAGSVTFGTSEAGSVKGARMIADIFKTLQYADGWTNLIGQGFGVKVDENNRAQLQVDDLLVLGRMIVHTLNIREVTYIGGMYYLSPAASTAIAVQPLYSSTPSDTRTWSTEGLGTPCGYRLLWRADDGTIGTMNYWQQGDQAYCHTFNITEPGDYSDVHNQNYHRLVCRIGTITIDQDYHYADLANTQTCYLYDDNNQPILNAGGGTQFTGYVGNSNTVPAANDKVVCRGSQRDTDRMGVILISTEGEASIGIYDGIDYFDALNNYEVHYFSRTAVRMNAEKLTWKTTGTSETQASFMARANSVFLGIGNCGININDESITARGGKFKMQDDDGNDTFILNENGDLESKGSASFEGTVRAKNLFKTVAVSSGSNSSINDRCEVVTMMNADTNVTWIYVLNNIPESTYGHAFTAGQMLTGHEINELVDNNSRFCWKTDTSNFRIFTGPADEIMLVNKVNYMYLGYTFIPRCQDFPGKEITIRNNTSNTSDAEIRQVDNAQNVFAAGAYVLSPADDYNDIGYGSNLSYHASVPQNKSVTLYSTGSVWLILRTF